MFAFCVKTFEPVDVKLVSTSKNDICRLIAYCGLVPAHSSLFSLYAKASFYFLFLWVEHFV